MTLNLKVNNEIQIKKRGKIILMKYFYLLLRVGAEPIGGLWPTNSLLYLFGYHYDNY